MTSTEDAALTSELINDLHKAAGDAAKGVRDPAEVRAACEEMDRIREEIRKKHGVLDIGVPAIRDLRDFMKYVLDSSVAFKWLVPEADTDKALRIRDDFNQAIIELIAPDIFLVEATHALTRAERQGRVTPAQGAVLLKGLLKTILPLHPYLPLLPRAYEISSTMRIGVYDCLYIALAEREKCDFVTADAKLKNIQTAFPFIIPLSSMP